MKRRPAVSRKRLTGRFVVTDFAEVLLKLPEGCPVVGGQAVAWWAAQYGASTTGNDRTTTLTSADIDFWGGRDDLEELARRLECEATFPLEYEMTVWVGGIPLSIRGESRCAPSRASNAAALSQRPGKTWLRTTPSWSAGSLRYSSSSRIHQSISPSSVLQTTYSFTPARR
jgi:hypothetical protein